MRRLAAVLVLVACRPPGYDKHPGGGSSQVDAAPPAVDAALDAPAACDHAFRLDGHVTSTSVWLSGDFVMWASTPGAGAIAFAQGTDGGWTVMHAFTAGTYQYKFILDGSTWILDPTNPNTVDDGMGNTNSVYTCVP